MPPRDAPENLSDQERELEDPREALAEAQAPRSWLQRLFGRTQDEGDAGGDSSAGDEEPPVTGIPEEPPVTGYPADTDEDGVDTAQEASGEAGESVGDDGGTEEPEESDEDGTGTAQEVSDEGEEDATVGAGDAGGGTIDDTADDDEDETESSADIVEGGDDTSGTETGTAIPVGESQSTIVTSGDAQGSDVSTGDANVAPVEADNPDIVTDTDGDDAFARPVGRIGTVFDRTDDGPGIETSELEEQARLIREATRPQLAPEVIEARLGGVGGLPGPRGPDESPDLAFGTGASADNVHEVALGLTADLDGPTDVALEPPLDPANVLAAAGDDDLGVLDDSGAIDEAPQGGTDTLADPDDDPDP